MCVTSQFESALCLSLCFVFSFSHCTPGWLPPGCITIPYPPASTSQVQVSGLFLLFSFFHRVWEYRQSFFYFSSLHFFFFLQLSGFPDFFFHQSSLGCSLLLHFSPHLTHISFNFAVQAIGIPFKVRKNVSQGEKLRHKLKGLSQLGAVAHTFTLSTQEAGESLEFETGRRKSFKRAWVTATQHTHNTNTKLFLSAITINLEQRFPHYPYLAHPIYHRHSGDGTEAASSVLCHLE